MQVDDLSGRVVRGIRVVAWNAGGKLGSAAQLAAWLSLMRHERCNFDVAWVSELDAKLRRGTTLSLPGFKVLRRWGGKGCKPMAWILREQFAKAVSWHSWTSRSGALLLNFGGERRVWLQGIHAAHGGAYQHSLSEVARLLRQKKKATPAYIFGDFNCDLLPVWQGDPYALVPGRMRRHAIERMGLYALMEARKLVLSEVAGMVGSPILASMDEALGVPITRTPAVGLAEAGMRPSALDHVLTTKGHEIGHVINWKVSVSDHAALSFEIPLLRRVPPQRSSTWRVTSAIDVEKAASEVVARRLTGGVTVADAFIPPDRRWSMWGARSLVADAVELLCLP